MRRARGATMNAGGALRDVALTRKGGLNQAQPGMAAVGIYLDRAVGALAESPPNNQTTKARLVNQTGPFDSPFGATISFMSEPLSAHRFIRPSFRLHCRTFFYGADSLMALSARRSLSQARRPKFGTVSARLANVSCAIADAVELSYLGTKPLQLGGMALRWIARGRPSVSSHWLSRINLSIEASFSSCASFAWAIRTSHFPFGGAATDPLG